MRDIPGSAERQNFKNPLERLAQRAGERQSQSSCSIREIARELAAMGYTNKGGARRVRRHASKDAGMIPL